MLWFTNLFYKGNDHETYLDKNTCWQHFYSVEQGLFEPRHEISNNVACATSKGSDQPARMRSVIRAFASRLNIL